MKGYSMLAICKLCGKYAEFQKNLWYQYDNGEMFVTAVCGKCADLHEKLVSA